ncbi:MAG: hypothetical protein FWD14_04105 [Treponema sp.]|nr:hypothetical protein [Treponema sp.]
MKKIVICLIISVFAAGFISAQELPKITIVNNTGYLIYEVYASPDVDDSWGEDWLDVDQTITPGQSLEITLKYPINQYSVYDFMLIDLDNDTYTKWGVTITANARIEFVFEDIDWD